jgi:hypothetical protein
MVTEFKPGMAVHHKDGFNGIFTGQTRSHSEELYIIIKQNGKDYGAYLTSLTPYKKVR